MLMLFRYIIICQVLSLNSRGRNSKLLCYLANLKDFVNSLKKNVSFLEDGRTLPLGIPGKGEDEQERYQEGTGEEGQLSERVGWSSNPHLHTGVSFQVDLMKCEESAINVDLFELNLIRLSV